MFNVEEFIQKHSYNGKIVLCDLSQYITSNYNIDKDNNKINVHYTIYNDQEYSGKDVYNVDIEIQYEDFENSKEDSAFLVTFKHHKDNNELYRKLLSMLIQYKEILYKKEYKGLKLYGKREDGKYDIIILDHVNQYVKMQDSGVELEKINVDVLRKFYLDKLAALAYSDTIHDVRISRGDEIISELREVGLPPRYRPIDIQIKTDTNSDLIEESISIIKEKIGSKNTVVISDTMDVEITDLKDMDKNYNELKNEDPNWDVTLEDFKKMAGSGLIVRKYPSIIYLVNHDGAKAIAPNILGLIGWGHRAHAHFTAVTDMATNRYIGMYSVCTGTAYRHMKEYYIKLEYQKLQAIMNSYTSVFSIKEAFSSDELWHNIAKRLKNMISNEL